MEANSAGNKPARIPIKDEIVTPRITFSKDIIRSNVPRSGNVNRKTKNIPKRPPKILRKEDSNKNCIKIKYFLAPSDF